MADTHRTCEICGIKERHLREKRFFATFPRNINRCREWVKLVGKEDLAYLPVHKISTLKHVCTAHFSKRDFAKSKRHLKKHATPNLNLSMPPLSDDILDEFMRLNADVAEIPRPLSTNPAASTSQTSSALEKMAEIPRPQSTNPAAVLPPAASTIQTSSALEKTQKSTAPEQGEVSKAVAFDHTYNAPVASGSVCTEIVAEIPRPQSINPAALLPPTVSISQTSSPLEKISTSTASEQGVLSKTVPFDHTYAASMASGSASEIEVVQPVSQSSETVADASSSHQRNPTAIVEKTLLTSKAGEATIQSSSSVRKETSNELENKGTKRKLDYSENQEITPRKRKLINQLKKTKCTLASLKKSAKLIENLSSPILKEFVLSALKNQKRKPKGQRWTTKNKISALAIFKRSPKAFRYLQHVMPLPSIKTLQNILKKIPMEPGLNRAVLDHLKKVAPNLKPNDKLCSLAFDEIALKERLSYNMATDKVEGYVDLGNERKGELANHALVFMLQGIGKKMKQPLAFYFVKGTISSEKLAVIIQEIIREVNATGFHVLTTVCDQGPTNMGALKLLKEWSKGGDNYFMIEHKKVYIIYDVPHCLYLSKITPTHVQPMYKAQMKVKYASQILSQTVAVVLKLLARSVENQGRAEQILQTALLVEDFNKLYDYTNGPASANDIKKGIRENVSAKTNHLRVWAEYRKKLATLKFMSINGTEAKNVKCVQGYITTLQSIRDIWSEVQEAGYKYLNLRQLNQDALENLFGLIRQHGQTNKHPTCSTFMAALKTSVISGMTAPHSKSSNCEKDYQLLLTDFHDLVFGDRGNEGTTSQDKGDGGKTIHVQMDKENEIPVLSIPEEDDEEEMGSSLAYISEQPLVYISGYIASIVLKKKYCINCKNIMTVVDPVQNPIYDFIKLKEWWQNIQCLTYPSEQLCQMIQKGINSFQKEVVPNLHNMNICQWTMTIFYSNCNTAWLCIDHVQEMANFIFLKLALLLIRRQCQIINLKNALKEENLADSNKKGQQYGVTK